MDPTLAAFLRSWPLDPWVVVPLLVTAGLYLRGWRELRRRAPRRFGTHQLLAFLGGLSALFLALASPLEAFAPLLLQVHMVQHLLLMIVAPPLLWLGAPLLPVLRGLPAKVRHYWVVPVFRSAIVRAGFRRLTHPAVAWVLFIAATWLWHAPQMYGLTLRGDAWHYLEHACFLGTALLFWYPVVQPYPSRPRYPRWVLLPYLVLADVQNTLLSAVLTFSDSVLYPHYANAPRLWGVTALDDQAAAGLIMWVPGSLVYLVPLVLIAQRLLYGETRRPGALQAPVGRLSLPLVTAPSSRGAGPAFDLLRVAGLGRFLRWRHARPVVQFPMLILAGAIVLDGLLGPQVAPLNLAGVLPWIHWRGLVVLGLLVVGNCFCFACPFMLPRQVARRWLPARRDWPGRLRSKWLAVGLLVVFFWAYEAFSLWASPWWTAWIVVGYFAAALVIDGLFRGASFCKYVCPIGQFHFAHASVSPLEVRVRDPGVCRSCRTRECIRGGDGIPGCELHLFQPRKSGNLDCTFCLDCAHACPHANVGVLAAAPGADLVHDRYRSGVGRLGRRPDLAALVLVLVFAAFANAAGMVAPVVDWRDRAAAALGLASPQVVITVSLLVSLLLLPPLCVGTAAVVGCWWSGDAGRRWDAARRFSYALLPLGFGMWLAHYSFHFLTSADAAVPAVQRGLADLGWARAGEFVQACRCCCEAAPWLLRLEILALDLGLLLSLHVGYRIARDRGLPFGPALKSFAPWAVLMLLLFALGIWIVFQPMEMRGTYQG